MLEFNLLYVRGIKHDMVWCYMEIIKNILVYQPEVDYFPLTACPEVFYPSHSVAISHHSSATLHIFIHL